MKPLPVDFLEMIAEQEKIYNREREIFIAVFSIDLRLNQIAEQLGIRPDNLSRRMTDIYRKFGINGLEQDRSKRERLSRELFDIYINKQDGEPLTSSPEGDDDGPDTPENAIAKQYKDPKKFPELLEKLTKREWNQVFRLLVTTHLHQQEAKEFLEKMKAEIDKLLTKDERLQEFLEWVNKKSQSLAQSIVDSKNQPHLAAIRACYFDFDIGIDVDRSFAYRLEPDFTRDFTCASFIARAEKSSVIETFPKLSEIKGLQESHQLDPAMAIVFERANALQALLEKTDSNTTLGRHLRELEKELPDLSDTTQDETILNKWYDEKGHDWGIKLRLTIVGYFSLGEQWRYQIETNEDLIEESHNEEVTIFTEEQYELLEKYYYANKLFLECLDGDNISPKVREEFKNTLFLPI
ncbi:hypothetical protein, partial [Crocosphaera sp.]|uniref:helix-turn-helix transcriptional regulator n=1 Tax=Crocosphaera sp. TaxID=2729996 RepID=UPI00257D8F8B